MNYSNNPAMVRVDFFSETGKWHAVREMEWLHYNSNMSVRDAFLRSLRASFNGMYSDMTAVCLEPYHVYTHPIMVHKWNEQTPSPLKLT